MQRQPLIHERLTHSIIAAFYEVYNTLGFGFFEQVYSKAMEFELRARGHKVGREVWVPVYYKGSPLSRQRVDMLVDDKVIVGTSRQ
jgi:GxxExxY protein